MRTLSILLLPLLFAAPAQAIEVFNLNVFDQLQGEWKPDFRARRMAAVAHYVNQKKPELVIFQEAIGDLPGAEGGGTDSPDGAGIAQHYPHRRYIHEMTGKDGASYGYWIGSRQKPDQWIEDGFSFPGGVERKVQGAYFAKASDGACLGVMSLHLSYQNSSVRLKEADWILNWLKEKERLCPRWLVVGDFNADRLDPEMQALFQGGLRVMFKELKPTVGAFNPIRRIYGENIPSKTIDWALGWNASGEAKVILDSPYQGEWVSDHAAVAVKISKSENNKGERK
jgi:endonuclease/exonuclease/phosphatase family metal-dependent hydrolase